MLLYYRIIWTWEKEGEGGEIPQQAEDQKQDQGACEQNAVQSAATVQGRRIPQEFDQPYGQPQGKQNGYSQILRQGTQQIQPQKAEEKT